MISTYLNAKKYKKLAGFSIVELVVVIVVIGILAAIVLISYSGIFQKAIAASLQSDLKNASTLLEMDSVRNGEYPASVAMANKGQGLKPSPGTTFLYSINSEDGSYCLMATSSNGISYYVDSINKTPTEGVCAGSEPAELFGIGIAGVTNEIFATLVQSNDGSFFAAGYSDSYTSAQSDMFVSKFNPNGTISWSRSLGGPGFDFIGGMIASDDGGIVIVGGGDSFSEEYSYEYDAFIVKMSSDGNVIWAKLWDSGGNDILLSVDKLNNGNYVAVGSTNGYGEGSSDVLIVSFDNSGNLDWDITWGGTDYESDAASIIATSDGGFVVSGQTEGFGTEYNNIFIAKFNSAGVLSWDKVWSGDEEAHFGGVAQASSGNYYINGEIYNAISDTYEILTLKYTSSGILSSSRKINGDGNDVGRDIISTSDGGYISLNISESFYNDDYRYDEILLSKYDASDNISWARTIGSPWRDSGFSIIQSSDGGYVISGSTEGYGNANDALLVKFDSSGQIDGCSTEMCQNHSISDSTISADYDASPSASVNSISGVSFTPLELDVLSHDVSWFDFLTAVPSGSAPAH